MTLDVAANARYKSFSGSLGYAVFAREQEKLTLKGTFPSNLFIAGQLASSDGAGNFDPNVVYAAQKNMSINKHIAIAQNDFGDPNDLANQNLALTAGDLNINAASMPQYFSQKIMATLGYAGRVREQLLHLNVGASYEFLHYGNSYNVYSLFGALTLKM